MKVKLKKEYKEYITIAEMQTVRKIISEMKEDEFEDEDYAKIAIEAAYNGIASTEILKCSASIAKNSRIWNAYNEESKNIDIYIEAIAFINKEEFIIIGAYLTDIWQIGSNNISIIKSHMYIRKFKEN